MWILLLSATVESWILLGKEKNFPVLRFCFSSWSKNFKRRRMSYLIMYIQGLHQENETPEQLRQLRFIWHFRGEEAKGLVLKRGAKKLQEDGRANVVNRCLLCQAGTVGHREDLDFRPCRVLPATPTPFLVDLCVDSALPRPGPWSEFFQAVNKKKDFLSPSSFLKIIGLK